MPKFYNRKQIVSVELYLRDRDILYSYKKKKTLLFGLITLCKEGFYYDFFVHEGPFSEEELWAKSRRVIEKEVFNFPYVIFNFSDDSEKRKNFLTEEEAQTYFDKQKELHKHLFEI